MCEMPINRLTDFFPSILDIWQTDKWLGRTRVRTCNVFSFSMRRVFFGSFLFCCWNQKSRIHWQNQPENVSISDVRVCFMKCKGAASSIFNTVSFILIGRLENRHHHRQVSCISKLIFLDVSSEYMPIFVSFLLYWKIFMFSNNWTAIAVAVCQLVRWKIAHMAHKLCKGKTNIIQSTGYWMTINFMAYIAFRLCCFCGLLLLHLVSAHLSSNVISSKWHRIVQEIGGSNRQNIGNTYAYQ